MRIGEFVDQLNRIADEKGMEHVKTSAFTNWLVHCGMMEDTVMYDGKTRRMPTAAGLEMGIAVETGWGSYGQYQFISYNQNAQQFLLDNMESVLALRIAEAEALFMQGKPWTEEQVSQLRELFAQNMSIADIAKEMGRTKTSIRGRLQKMGLINVYEPQTPGETDSAPHV